jgi:hypothetical protein
LHYNFSRQTTIIEQIYSTPHGRKNISSPIKSFRDSRGNRIEQTPRENGALPSKAQASGSSQPRDDSRLRSSGIAASSFDGTASAHLPRPSAPHRPGWKN